MSTLCILDFYDLTQQVNKLECLLMLNVVEMLGVYNREGVIKALHLGRLLPYPQMLDQEPISKTFLHIYYVSWTIFIVQKFSNSSERISLTKSVIDYKLKFIYDIK